MNTTKLLSLGLIVVCGLVALGFGIPTNNMMGIFVGGFAFGGLVTLLMLEYFERRRE